MNATPELIDRFQGMLIGTAVGDALGLPMEGLSARRTARVFRPPLQHRFILGRGMISDDTEHTIFVTQSLLRFPDAPDAFARRLAWYLRWWLAALPAGVGLATLRSILKLWVGFSPNRSGVYSAGNGPAMRAAPIGARFWRQPDKITPFISASSRLTHTDDRAEIGARAVAQLAALGIGLRLTDRPSVPDFIAVLHSVAPEHQEWLDLVTSIERGLATHLSVKQYAHEIGATKGVSGYVFQTVPVVVYSWYRNFGSFRDSIEDVIACGGDSDSTGAIIGAIAGATVGASAIPKEWIEGIIDWPRGVRFLRNLGQQLALSESSNGRQRPLRYAWPAVLPRNAVFLCLVLGHGVRRLLPPY
ncbi:MAG: hypothetical protein GY906_21175 [bacterium]|nr:hypothetical protein [bacterium]